MLEQYFSKVEDQERMKATLREIAGKDYDGKLLIFRGKGANGKTTFYHALANVFDRLVHRKLVIDTDRENENWQPKAGDIKGEDDLVFVHETNIMKPFDTTDAGLARRVVDFHFDQTFTKSDKKEAEIIRDLEAYLQSIMA